MKQMYEPYDQKMHAIIHHFHVMMNRLIPSIMMENLSIMNNSSAWWCSITQDQAIINHDVIDGVIIASGTGSIDKHTPSTNALTTIVINYGTMIILTYLQQLRQNLCTSYQVGRADTSDQKMSFESSPETIQVI